VFQKRDGQDEEAVELTQSLATAETLRSAANAPAAPGEKKKDEEHVSVFWRVFGGTILSIVALAAVTLYNNLSSGISDLRAELSKEREARSALSKKDDVDTRTKAIYDRIRVTEGYKVELEALKERVTANAAAVEAVKRDSVAALDGVKKDTVGLDVIKERLTAVEALKKDTAALEVVKERLAAAVTDLKAVRDELAKVSQELERNKAADLERKTSRDAQAKQLDETLKDMQKGLQACREKLARLEGAQPAGPPAPKGSGTGDAKKAPVPDDE
jgi:DNA repair exonuclease SbcCD ATPase subunit